MTDTPIRHCTVTVSGDRGCGKSTLIAILAQALQGAGHEVNKPDHIKNASQAISDLHHKFQVHFVEAAEGEAETLTLKLDTSAVADVLDQTREQLESALTTLDQERADRTTVEAGLQKQIEACHRDMKAARDDNAEKTRLLTETRRRAEAAEAEAYHLTNTRDELEAKIDRIMASKAQALTPAEADRMITKVLTYARDAAILDLDATNLSREIDERRSQQRKMRDEATARSREASNILRRLLTGAEASPVTPASIQVERRAAAQRMSASDKLALANGAQPKTAAEAVVAQAVEGCGEATLAGAIERHLTAGESFPLLDRLIAAQTVNEDE